MRALVIAAAAACAAAACGRSGQDGSQTGGSGTRTAQAAERPAPNVQQPAAPAGQAVFGRTCVTCHQANGQGLAGAFPPLAGSAYVNGDKAKLIKLVLSGMTGPVTVRGQRFNSMMPPWKGQLSDTEIAAVLSYVRGSFGNAAGPVTAEEVGQARTATASRSAPWTAQELDRSP